MWNCTHSEARPVVVVDSEVQPANVSITFYLILSKFPKIDTQQINLGYESVVDRKWKTSTSVMSLWLTESGKPFVGINYCPLRATKQVGLYEAYS